MKKALKLKAFMLSMVMGFALLPMNMFAQSSDDFFCVDDAFNGNRNVVAWNITNNGIGQSEAPVGSGLLVLGAIGAGYAIAKRKRNKKGAALLLALALTLGFTQCKKKVVEPISSVTGGTTYHISVPAGDGSKVVVNPVGGGTYATVGFEDGDVIYVGYNNAYVGTITYNGAAGKKCFEGDITTSIVGEQPLHLYLLGGKGFTVNMDGNTATVVISDQSSKYPVVSYSPTTTNFTGSGSYEATLHNKCSIMKFIVATGTNYANDPIRMTGMHNKVTVDFATPEASENGFSYSVNTTDGGLIKMPTVVANVTWAIVLPQAALDLGTEGSAYTNGYIGKRPVIAAIARNTYYDSGVSLDLTTPDDSKVKDLKDVDANWTAEDGWTLTGTLSGNYKITIADGAMVTLDNVSINYPSGPNYESGFAGITCLGDATIILKNGTTNNVAAMDYRYPGIQVGPSGKTLTIQGTGALNARYRKKDIYDISYGCGIGGGKDLSCGNIVINGGIINAVALNKAAGIGSGWGFSQPISCGTITINGGTVTATGGAYAAGIGTGYAEGGNNSCGAISINGGTVTATGGLNAAGIGTGDAYTYYSKTNTCASITITDGVTQVTATKGSNAPNSIGAGKNGTCGTVTIGGVEGAISTSPYTYIPAPAPVAPSGAIEGLFSVSSTKQVYFSQGNLQYTKSTGVWSFMEHQYSTVETTGSYCTNDYGNRDVVSLFGWATSGYNHGATCYQPYSTNPTNDNYYAYGNASYNLYDQTGQADWGYNAISNGGNTENSGWRTLTTAEWQYLFANHTTGWSSVNGVNGYVIRPDGVSTAIAASYTASDWDTEEAAGAVFLPAAGYRNSYVGTYVYDKGSIGRYWSSSADGSNANYVNFSNSSLGPNYTMNRNYGLSVRLVKNAD